MDEINQLVGRATASHLALKEKQRAFGEVVRRYQDLAFGYAYAIVGDFQLAEDAAQEAFLAAWRHLDQLRNPEAFAGWFKRIVVSQCSRLTRGRSIETVSLEAALDLPCEAISPEAAAERSETRGQVLAAVQSLPEGERLVTTLFYINEFTQNEVAAFLELPLTTVKKRLWSARQKLRQKMLETMKQALQERRPSRDERFAETVALYNEALDSLVARLKEERYVLAAILYGSLSYDEVWEKSDIDLLLIGTEEKKPVREFVLVENGVNVHATLMPRSKLKALVEGQLQGSFTHSWFSRSTLLFSRDESIRAWYDDNPQRVGERDKELQLLRVASGALYCATKGQKWFHVKRDMTYACLWVLYAANQLASVEALMHNEVASREALQQALRLNPGFFKQVYTDLLHGPKDEATVGAAVAAVERYVEDRLYTIFRPILQFLEEEGGVRSTTELDAYFGPKVQQPSLLLAYEWLADKGIIQKVSAPLRLTEKSRVTMDEAAYYYDGGDGA